MKSQFDIIPKRTTKVAAPKLSAAIKQFLRSSLPRTARLRTWEQLEESDLVAFKKDYALRPNNADKRRTRQEIKKWFVKPVRELTLADWQDYQKPSFHAPDYLKELWPQLKPAEQDLVKQCNEWAFAFPASFETDEQFLRACAARLERFFGRKFCVKGQAEPSAAR